MIRDTWIRLRVAKGVATASFATSHELSVRHFDHPAKTMRDDPSSGDHGPADLHTDESGITRCRWCLGDPTYVDYHDQEWGRPVVDPVRLFEKICLEGFQAGLSWLTILKRRPRFREVFADFDFKVVARWSSREVDQLVQDATIIRHRGKIEATIHNAARAVEMDAQPGGLPAFFWSYEPEPAPAWQRHGDIPAMTEVSKAMSKELKRRGWKFVGPTTCYAFMQAMGMVNDHLLGCDKHAVIEQHRRQWMRPK